MRLLFRFYMFLPLHNRKLNRFLCKRFYLSAVPKDGYQEFLMNEARYARLTREFPERATDLFAKNEAAAKERWEHLNKLVEMYKD